MRGSDRVFLLLELLGAGPPQSLTELAERAELPKPTVLRFLRSLETSGWVTRDADSRYSLGPAVIALAHQYLANTSVVAAAAGPMRELRDALGETISLSALAGDQRVCVHELPSPEPLRHVHEIGSEAPLHAGASGRLLLAHMPAAARARFLRQRLPRFTATTLTDPAELERDCEQVRERGYALSFGEKTAGSVALAVPIRDQAATPVFALAVFAPEVRFDARRDVERWARALQAAARTVEDLVGVQEPSERAVA